jgi:uncharacterized Ntn-hydrolase superfamily protein
MQQVRCLQRPVDCINFKQSHHMKKALLTLMIAAGAAATNAQHTFSIVAVDVATGEIGSAGATCGDSIMWPGTPGAKLISYVEPGKFAIHTQAYHLPDNHTNAITRMTAGDSPQQAIDWLVTNDEGFDSSKRQYGIVDWNSGSPRSAAFTGSGTDNYKNHITGPGYAIQGNILLGQQILDSMQSRFLNTSGSLAKRLMAALQGANVPGADTRCLSNGTSSLSAFLRVAKPTDAANNLFIDINVGAVPTGVEPINVLQVKLNAVLSIEDNHALAYTYSLHPNPASGKLNIEFNNVLPEKITITDAVGRTVRIIRKSDIRSRNTVDVSALTSGLYVISFLKEGMAVHNARVVID